MFFNDKTPAPEGLRAIAAVMAAQKLIELRAAKDTDQSDVEPAIRDCWIWLSQYTQTYDAHYVEAGFPTPYRPFPDKPYFAPVLEEMKREPIIFLTKSRDLMISWLCVGYLTHCAMLHPEREVIFQSLKAEKAWDLVGYAKTLYARQHPELRERYPLTKPLNRQPVSSLEFANGSVIHGIPEGAEQIRSHHPWALFGDEVAFQPKAGESYEHAVPVCNKIIMVSSAGPGWFADVCQDNI